MLSDAHAHLDRFPDQEVAGVVQRAREASIKVLLTVGTDLDSSARAIALAEAFDIVYAAVGIHPVRVQSAIDEATYDELRQLALNHPKVVAVSETGLDFEEGPAPPSIQEQVFRQHLRLARELKMPIILHDREGKAHTDSLRILREEKAYEVGGASHYFQGDAHMARQYVEELDFLLSFGKVITRAEGSFLHPIIRCLPMKSILIETDASPRQEQTIADCTEPAHARLTADKIAQLRGEDFQEVARATTNNLRRLLKLGH